MCLLASEYVRARARSRKEHVWVEEFLERLKGRGGGGGRGRVTESAERWQGGGSQGCQRPHTRTIHKAGPWEGEGEGGEVTESLKTTRVAESSRTLGTL